jgi:hypothetical protein
MISLQSKHSCKEDISWGLGRGLELAKNQVCTIIDCGLNCIFISLSSSIETRKDVYEAFTEEGKSVVLKIHR